MKTQFLAFLSFAVALSADAATVHKAPLKGLLIDNASVVTDVTGMDAATRLESADGRTWIDAAGDVHQAQRKAVFNGMEAVSGNDPAGGTVEWMFYDRGPEGGYCQLTYDAGRWDLTLERLEDVENGDEIYQEMVQRTWSANAPWNSSTVTLNGDWGTETVQLSFVTGIVNRIAFTNDVPKVDLSGLSRLTTNDVAAIVTNEVAGGLWDVKLDGVAMPGWTIVFTRLPEDFECDVTVDLVDDTGKWQNEMDIGMFDLTNSTFFAGNIWDGEFAGKFCEARWISASRNALGLAMAKDLEKLPNQETVTNVARDVSNSFWDEENQVLWRMEFRGGEPMFVPVTNENVKASGGVL